MTDTSKRTNEEIVREIADSIHESDHRMLDKMTSKGRYWLETYDGEGVEKAIKRVAMEALNTKDRERDEAVAEAVRRERERIVAIATRSKDAFMVAPTQKRFVEALTTPQESITTPSHKEHE